MSSLLVCVESVVRRAIPFFAFVLFWVPVVLSQDKLVTSQETNERIRQLSTLSQLSQVRQGEYVIGAGDTLAVQVFDVAELTRDVRVTEQGTISLPLLPARLRVSGMTEIQAEKKLEEVLATSGLVTHAQVSVTVKERKSNPITVIGAVAHPMVYQAVRPVTLLEVLSEAGGISNDAGNVVLITRRPSNPGQVAAVADQGSGQGLGAKQKANSVESRPTDREQSFPSGSSEPGPSPDGGTASDSPSVLSISLIDLLETGDPKYNIPLQGGDAVAVPRAGIIYVMGAVERPGGFVLANDREAMSVMKVMALAGGPKSTAKSSQSVIMHRATPGSPPQEVHLDLKRLMEHKAEDVRLNPGDIVFVPDSSGKRVARRIGEVALAVGTGAVIFRLAR